MEAAVGGRGMGALWAALRAEPKMRSYLVASLVDDLGIAASTWAWQLLIATLFVDQRTRAAVMMPSLLCFVLGAIVGGPLADWGGRYAARRGLARWRWSVLLWGRGIETFALGALALSLIGHEPTLARLAPYFFLSAFMKTALRPTRIALQVDLLRTEHVPVDAEDRPLEDERGAPLRVKTHLLTFSSWLGAVSALATVAGLLIGGRIVTGVGGRVWIVALLDVLSNVVFLALLATKCRPEARPAEAGLGGIHAAGQGLWNVAFRELWVAFRQTFAFLRHPARRPLVTLLGGAVLIEAIAECYDGRMIIKQVLRASDDALRHSELFWMLAALVTSLALPLLAARFPKLGPLFVGLMLIDGVVMILAGRAAAAGAGAAVLPFALALTADRGLTAASSTIAELAQNSSSSAALRGRLAATYTLVVLVADILAQGLATGLAESIGIPSLVSSLGFVQIAIIGGLAVIGGRRLLGYRFDRARETIVEETRAAQPASA